MAAAFQVPPPRCHQSILTISLPLSLSLPICLSHTRSLVFLSVFFADLSLRTRCRVWKTVCFTCSKLVPWLLWQYLILSLKLSIAEGGVCVCVLVICSINCCKYNLHFQSMTSISTISYKIQIFHLFYEFCI